MSTLTQEATVEVLDGTLQEVREKLNGLSNENRRVRAVVWRDAPGAHSPVIEDRELEAIAYLQERLRRPLPGPAEIEQGEAELRELQLRLHQNRLDAGEVSVLPDTITSPESR